MANSLAIFGFGGPVEAIIIGGVVLLLFGNRIPGMARSLGQGIVEFRKGLKGDPADSDEEKKLPNEKEKKKEES